MHFTLRTAGEPAAFIETVRKTVVLVTHDLREAHAMADRIGVLDDGRLVASGTLAELGASTHPFVRRLLETLEP